MQRPAYYCEKLQILLPINDPGHLKLYTINSNKGYFTYKEIYNFLRKQQKENINKYNQLLSMRLKSKDYLRQSEYAKVYKIPPHPLTNVYLQGFTVHMQKFRRPLRWLTKKFDIQENSIIDLDKRDPKFPIAIPSYSFVLNYMMDMLDEDLEFLTDIGLLVRYELIWR